MEYGTRVAGHNTVTHAMKIYMLLLGIGHGHWSYEDWVDRGSHVAGLTRGRFGERGASISYLFSCLLLC